MSNGIFKPVLKKLGLVDLIDLTVMVSYYNLLVLCFTALNVEQEESFIRFN